MKIFQKHYEPLDFNDLVFADSSTRQRLLEYAENKRHGSMLFYGPYGTAKTTTAKIIAQERSAGLGFRGDNFYRATDLSNASFQRIANTRRLDLFAGVQLPVTIVDEIDKVPDDLQYKLRWELDLNCEVGTFIFTTNKLHAVEPGLRHRCDIVELPLANTSHWLDRARWILEQEGISRSDAKLLELIEGGDGSIRDLLRKLEDISLRAPRVAA
ncbi:AAA family ATPase [Thalassobaculum litoreum]|uniref:ATPase family associated with various cellular activities (AAA) n=1 Tax=Thalassobaculum litoreum DSM 18839 TaxID=1123362 RepID=A0A8G2BII4_9PROT|nr:AAA family ATPase [Thalassobaculum litoreum]SDF82237.1 ATPase family associated with various cellular activities (AAA) [Thalassobaculum litoreum DSM 18839]